MALKFKIIRYKDIVEKCFIKFFNKYNDSFIKDSDSNKYILAENISKSKLFEIFKTNILIELTNIAKSNIYYFLVGDCIPDSDLFFQFIDKNKNIKLCNIINNAKINKYILYENDINIDFDIFDSILDDIFISFFSNKYIDINDAKIIPIKHSRLGSAAIRDILLYYYNGNDISIIYFDKTQKCIISITDLIYSSVKNKTVFNTSTEFNKIKNEIIKYLKEIFN